MITFFLSFALCFDMAEEVEEEVAGEAAEAEEEEEEEELAAAAEGVSSSVRHTRAAPPAHLMRRASPPRVPEHTPASSTPRSSRKGFMSSTSRAFCARMTACRARSLRPTSSRWGAPGAFETARVVVVVVVVVVEAAPDPDGCSPPPFFSLATPPK